MSAFSGCGTIIRICCSGTTRGVYLEGYGAVFTAEVNLVMNRLSLMNPPADERRNREGAAKEARPDSAAEEGAAEALVATAASLDPVPAEEQIAIVAFLSIIIRGKM